MAEPRILIACIGNIFLGDDGFGCEVARRLAARELPAEARLVDFGIRGFDLAYALLDGHEVTVFVDAAPRGGEPGTLYLIEPDLDELDALDPRQAMVETHGMNPMKVLCMVKSMGGSFKRIFLVGCEPATLGPDEGQMGLSEPVEAAVDGAVGMVESLVSRILEEGSEVAVSNNST
ncbi:MAG TPA: hydrogenase maturation protease [Blastocatellia bacterium]|jgi:hydrogenase maturation protease|nr:hydrogenase maturation protease [Blastocatellia bacterium]